ncbi:MAG: hypothetical protein ACK40X_12495 [Armatimonadota bacterium]
MFVMNFGAGSQNPYVPPTIPNEAITSQDGFPGAGMPLLWLLNAREGLGYPLRVVNYLNHYAHGRDVYAAIVVPDEDGQPDLAWTLGPIWDEVGTPIIEVNDERLRATALEWGVNEGLGFAMVIGHELGHTVLWHVDHNLRDGSQEFGGNAGHHVIGQDGRVGQHTIHCLMWPYFPPVICPSGFALCQPQFCPQSAQHWAGHPIGWAVFTPTEFCDTNPDCQHLWRLTPLQ